MKELKQQVLKKDKYSIWILKIYYPLIDSHKNPNHNLEQEDPKEDHEEDQEVVPEELQEEPQEVTLEEDLQEEEETSEVVEEEDNDVKITYLVNAL